MSRTKVDASVGVRADYLSGDPAQPGPITGGQLALEPGALCFTRPGARPIRFGIDDLEGMTVSGARSHSNGSNLRGTTRLAVHHEGHPTVWQFAVDRSHAATLRDRINRDLAESGRDPIPFVESLYEFEAALQEVTNGHGIAIHRVEESEAGKGSRNRSRRRSRTRTTRSRTHTRTNGSARTNGLARVNGAPITMNHEVAAEGALIATQRTSADDMVVRARQRRIMLALVALIVAIEIIATLLILFVF